MKKFYKLFFCVLISLCFCINIFSVDYNDKSTSQTIENKSIVDKDNAYSKGLDALRDGDGEKALSYLIGCLDKEPDNISIYINIAMAHSLMKNYDEAIKFGEIAITKDSANGRAFRKLGRIYALKNDTLKAYEIFLKACELEPENAWNFNNAGYMLILLKRYDEAIVKLEKALELDPSNPLFKKNIECAKSRIETKYEEIKTEETPLPQSKETEEQK